MYASVEKIFADLQLLGDIRLIEPHDGKGKTVLRAEGFYHFTLIAVIDGHHARDLASDKDDIVVIGGFQRRTLGKIEIRARIKPYEILDLVYPELIKILFPFFSDRTERRYFHNITYQGQGNHPLRIFKAEP